MENRFSFTKTLVKKAGDLVLEQLSESIEVAEKSSPDDLVTSADKQIQAYLVSEIQKRYPQDAFLAEEENLKSSLLQGSVWVIDPIDGTLNFVTQKSDFAIMLAYFEEGVGRFGIIYDVIGDKLYAGGGAFPVTCNEAVLKAFDGRLLSQSLVACNTGMLLQNEHGIADRLKTALGVRNYGCAGLSMAKVLKNQLWGYFSSLYPWDYAAAMIMGESLGYSLLTIEGEVPDFSSRQQVMFLPKRHSHYFQESLLNR